MSFIGLILLVSNFLLAQKVIKLPQEILSAEEQCREEIRNLFSSRDYDALVKKYETRWSELNQKERLFYLAAETLLARQQKKYDRLWRLLDLTEQADSLSEPARSDLRFIIEGLLKMHAISKEQRK